MNHDNPTLGVDIGRVLIHGDGPDTSFLRCSDDEALRAPALDGAFPALGRLVAAFAGRVWLVSKCGARIESRTRRWLDHHRFHERTGLPPSQVRFCRERPQKAGICRELGIGLFVDDRQDVLDAMAGIVPHRFLFGAASAPAGMVAAPTWAAAEPAILAAARA